VDSQIGGETRLLSWLPIKQPLSVSRHGKYTAIVDQIGIGGTDYAACLATLDGWHRCFAG
jgi:hypothetical protein